MAYQLIALGERALTGERGQIHSRKVYVIKDTAQQAIPEFTKLCMTELHKHDLAFMSRVDNVEIVEVEII